MSDEQLAEDQDYCRECDRVTRWSADERCDGCGRTWGFDAEEQTS
ncbi:hypothetical protein [Nesterenkonia sandarakina]|uniref:Uncharacterized protein n=1 Tax=Nesterenkonia sandarakina TaxID=272918 RepID=A0A2T0YJG0_9MICC|nr:hypothetical protein [Nesterenkonia sandarakina]PRZ15179.1 hypothetical protein BCL67_109100 [Nesterenkonia sandarakina]